jgi:hypothetical protein
MMSRGTPKGMGDYDPPDDEPQEGEDYWECAWCEPQVLQGQMGLRLYKPSLWCDDAIVIEEHTIEVEVRSYAFDKPLWSCKDCHAEGLTEFHPDEEE